MNVTCVHSCNDETASVLALSFGDNAEIDTCVHGFARRERSVSCENKCIDCGKCPHCKGLFAFVSTEHGDMR